MSNISHYNSVITSVSSTYRYPVPTDSLHRLGSGDDLDIFGITVYRSSIPKQMGFVRKVFLITASQFALTAGTSTVLVRVSPIFHWLQDSKYAWWVPLLPMFLVASLVAWHLWMRYFQLSPGARIASLVFYSISMAVITSEVVSKLCYDQGVLVLLMAIIGLFGILLFTLQTQVPFSGATPILVSAVSICMSSPWLRRVFDMDPVAILLPIVLAFLACCYVILELYYIMGNVTSDDVILANVCFYIDLVYPLRFLHNVCELTDKLAMFPDILRPDY